MREIRFSLVISSDELLRYYRGAARVVLVTTDQGLRVQLPAEIFRRFVTKDGVAGRFAVRFDERNKLVDVRRV